MTLAVISESSKETVTVYRWALDELISWHDENIQEIATLRIENQKLMEGFSKLFSEEP